MRARWSIRLGLELRALRVAAGLTQRELADQLLVARTTVQRAELGQCVPQSHIVECWEQACAGRLHLRAARD